MTLVVELVEGGDEWNHDFRTDVDSSSFRAHGRLEDGAALHLGDLGIGDTKPTPPMAKHGVGLAQRFHNACELGAVDPEGSRQELALLAPVRKKLVERWIEETYGHW